MTPTRRDLALLVSAGALAPRIAWAQVRAPVVIAECGSMGDGPPNTRPAYERAIAEGADFLAANLVATRDGDLVACPENEISATTDVADHPEFANRRTAKVIDDRRIEGWFTEDFSLAELKTLVCREGVAPARPTKAGEPRLSVLGFQDVVDLARGGSVHSARVIGVFVSLRQVRYFASLGLPLEVRLAEAIRVNGYNSPAAAMLVAAAEATTLQSFGALSRARRIQVLGPDSVRSDAFSADDLTARRGWAEGIGMAEHMVGESPGAIDAAHAVGLSLYAWASHRPRRPEDARKAIAALITDGVDGVVTDSPAVAARARLDALRSIERERSGQIRP